MPVFDEQAVCSIHITSRDRIPVSMNDQIKVEVLELSHGALDEREGTVEWPMDPGPGASSTLKLSFGIHHPEGWEVNYRTRVRKQKMMF